MSRIGKKIITVPAGVTFNYANHKVTVKGPKGELTQLIDPDFVINHQDSTVTVERPTEQKRHKSMHGLYRALIANMIEGVSAGYSINLELVGVGYKASVQSNVLELSLGYSHNIFLVVPAEVKISAAQEKGSNPIIALQSHDKQLIGQVAAKIRSLRKVEPYKGKGIRFVGEQIRRKAGKAAAK